MFTRRALKELSPLFEVKPVISGSILEAKEVVVAGKLIKLTRTQLVYMFYFSGVSHETLIERTQSNERMNELMKNNSDMMRVHIPKYIITTIYPGRVAKVIVIYLREDIAV